nr:MAG TPA: hypothetical protein [Caudoviricetes sp.]
MKLVISSFLFLIMVVVPAVLLIMFIIFAIRNIQKDAEEQGDTTLWTSKEKPPVPAKCIEDQPVTRRNPIHLRTVYIPYPISHNIEEIVTSVSDSEYKLGYMFDTMYSEKTDSGLVLFMRFKLL